MNEKQCKDCKYYHQHYGLDEKRIFKVYCGHCSFSRVKRREPDMQSCENFSPGVPDEEAFARKEYLSKKLLQYVLSLDLLPEIEDK